MPETIPISIGVSAMDLTPVDAIAFFERKKLKITWDWREQLTMNHRQAWTVAKATRMDVLKDIRESLLTAQKNGIPFAEFKKELKPILQSKGWWGKKTISGKTVQLGSPNRLGIIYDTNMQSAFNAGRWKSFEENSDNRPYLQYIAIEDAVTRPAHRRLNGTIKPINSTFWDTYYPPNGYRCRCRTRALTLKQAIQRGISKGTPKLKGKTVKPDPGFNSNPAKDPWQPKKSDYPADIWKLGQTLPYIPLILPKEKPITKGET